MADHLACVSRLKSQSSHALPLRDKMTIAAPRQIIMVHVAGKPPTVAMHRTDIRPFTTCSRPTQPSTMQDDPFVASPERNGGYLLSTPYALPSVGPIWSPEEVQQSPTAYALESKPPRATLCSSESPFTAQDLERVTPSFSSGSSGFSAPQRYAQAALSDAFRLESQSVVQPLRDRSNIVAPTRTKLRVHVAGTITDAVVYSRYKAKVTKSSDLVHNSDPFVADHGGYPFVTPATPYALQSIGPMWSSDDLTLSPTAYALRQRAAKAVTADSSFTVKDLERAGSSSAHRSPGFCPYGGYASPSLSDPFMSPAIPLSMGGGSSSNASSVDAYQQGGAPQASNLSTSSGFFAHRGYNQSNTRNASSADAPTQGGAPQASNLSNSSGFFAHRGYNQLNTRNTSSVDAHQQGGAPQASNLSTSSGFFAHPGYNQSSRKEDSPTSAAMLVTSSESSSDDEFGYSFQIVHLGANGQVSPLYHEPEGLESPPSARVQRVTKATTRMVIDDSPQQGGAPQASTSPSASRISRTRKAVPDLPTGIPKRVVSRKPVPRMTVDEDSISKVNMDCSQAKKKPLGFNRFVFEPRFSASPKSAQASPRVSLQQKSATGIVFGRRTTDVKQKKATDIPSRRITKDAGLGIQARPTGAKRISVKSAATVRSAKDNSDKASLVTHVADRSSLNRSEEVKSFARVEADTLDRMKEPLTFRSDVISASRASSRASRLPRPSTGGSVKQKVSLGPVKKDLREELADVKRAQPGMIGASRASSPASHIPRPSTSGSVKQKVSLGSVKEDLREELADMKRALNEQRGMIGDLYNRLRTSNEGPKTNEKALLAENKRLVAENSALKKANAEMKISAIRQRGELQRAQVDNVALKDAKARLSFQLKDIEGALSQQVQGTALELELLKGEAAHWKAKVYSLTRMVREAFADDAGSLQLV